MFPEPVNLARLQKLSPFPRVVDDRPDSLPEIARIPEGRVRPFAYPACIRGIQEHIDQLEEIIDSLKASVEDYDS